MPELQQQQQTGDIAGNLTAAQAGLLEQGNINLNDRPVVKNTDGSISTVRSMSFNEDGREILIPTVAADGSRTLSEREAIEQYRKSGQFLGKFDTPDNATAYGEKLHNSQAQQYAPKTQPQTGHPGADIVQHMLDAGFAPQEVAEWKASLRDQMFAGGISPKEMQDYWGDNASAPTDKLRATLAANLNALGPEAKAKAAADPLEAFLAGLQTSSTGLVARGKLPDLSLPENTTTMQKIAAASGQTVGELPEMALGFLLGGAGGSAAGGAVAGPPGAVGGAVLGSGAGGMALPELIRDILMDQYAHPDGSK